MTRIIAFVALISVGCAGLKLPRVCPPDRITFSVNIDADTRELNSVNIGTSLPIRGWGIGE